jgi:hypothetical protein
MARSGHARRHALRQFLHETGHQRGPTAARSLAVIDGAPSLALLQSRGLAPQGEGLKAFLGNQALLALRGEGASARTASTCSCGGSCSNCLQDEIETESPAAYTEPLEDFDEEDLKPGAPAASLGHMPIAAAPPDPAKAAGAVTCNKGAFQVWMNPGNSPCINDCVRKHEEKHVADFNADPNYKDYCKGVPDGDIVTYKSCDDAAKYEDAASDLEIDCLDKAIPGASKACQPIMTNRKDVTLPKYKKQVREGCGC